MSQNNVSEKHDDMVTPEADNGDAGKNHGDLEWGYSGKAFRTQCILYWIITIVLFAGAIYLTFFGGMKERYLPIWITAVALTVVLWVHFFTVYFYRTWTIRYKLTDRCLYTYQGFFTKKSDSMELIFIEDIQMTQTLWDRLFNGGVGRIIIHSSADKTDSVLTLKGIEDPHTILKRIDDLRSELRKRRAIMASGG